MKNVYAKWDKMNLILWAPGCWILEGSWRRVAVSASSSARRLRRWSRSLTCRRQTWQTKSEKTETNSTTLVQQPPRLKKTYTSFWELFAVNLSIAQGTNQSTTSNLKPNTNVGTKMIQVKPCISLTDARKSCWRNFRHPLQDMKELKPLKSKERV